MFFDRTLRTLENVARPPRGPRPKESRLVCGACQGEVKLLDHVLVCQTDGCGAKYASLRDLAVADDGSSAA